MKKLIVDSVLVGANAFSSVIMMRLGATGVLALNLFAVAVLGYRVIDQYEKIKRGEVAP